MNTENILSLILDAICLLSSDEYDTDKDRAIMDLEESAKRRNELVYRMVYGSFGFDPNIKYHCDYCRCPINKWTPLNSYPVDSSCELYSDVLNVAENIESATFEALFEGSLHLKNKYLDIPCFENTIRECFDSFCDCGVFNVDNIAI